MTLQKVSATGGAWSRSWHFAWLPASGGPVFPRCIFLPDGKGSSRVAGPVSRCGGPWATWVDGSRGGEETDSFFVFLVRRNGMEGEILSFFFFVLVNCLFFFWDVSLKIYWNNWNIIGVQRLIVFWNKVILWRWEQLQPDLQGLCQWSGNGTQMDHFLRPASVLAIAPLERCGKLERWNDICNSIDAVVFLKRNAGLFPLYRL